MVENQILIDSVKAHNAKGLTLSDIKAKDIKWRKESTITNYMKELMDNKAAKELLKLETKFNYLFESCLTGNQGANVAMTNKTSDYWQGYRGNYHRCQY